MEENRSIFEILYDVDLSSRLKTKGGLKYISWPVAWAEIKKVAPDVNFKIIPQIMDDGGNTRFWHDDGKSGWVEVCVTAGGIEHTEILPIMDMRNKAIPADQITSVEANKSYKRCLAKAVGLHGAGLLIWNGEDIPEETSKVNELQAAVMDLVQKRCAQSAKAKEKVAELCKEAEKKANPHLEDELISGNPMNIDSSEILEDLKKKLLAVRK